MIEIQRIKLDKSKRIIITSDIHGHLRLFKRLLEKVNYSEDDYLFINGDLCEKGPDSLGVIDYVQQLNSHQTFITKGNCDVIHRYVFEEEDWILPYMQNKKYSILNEMLIEQGKSLEDYSGLVELGQFYKENYKDVIDWLECLPIAYETDEYIIVHAGIHSTDLLETDEATALYQKAFYEKGHQEGKAVIVGHWPVANYRANQICSHNPIIDREKRIISIDGGNRIKKDGQLNALIIEDGDYSFCYIDDLNETAVVQQDYRDTLDRVGTVTYPNYEMKPIIKEEFFTKCENINLGKIQWIKNEYLLEKDGRYYSTNDLSVTLLGVKSGELVKLIDNTCEGYSLVKKMNGEVGWIPKDIIEK